MSLQAVITHFTAPPLLGMLRPRPYLFELITSLTKGEVTAFKRSIKHRHGFESYIRLFDYLRRRKEYDEEKLKKDLANEPVVGFLAVGKNYLYNTILQFLSSPGGVDKEKELYFRLMAAKKLMDKCLYHHALRIVKKAKKKAQIQENFKVLLELLDLEKANYRQILDGKSLSENIEEIIEEEEDTMAQLTQLQSLQHLYDRISVLDKDPSKVEQAHIYLGKAMELREEELSSVRAKTIFCRIQAQARLRSGDIMGLIDQLCECVNLIEANQDILLDRPFFQSYLEVLFNLGHAYILIGKDGEAQAIDHKLSLIETDEESKVRVLERQMIIELSIAHNQRNWETGEAMITRISDNLVKYRGRFHKAKELTLLYALSHYLISMGHPSLANKWLLELRQGQFSDYRLDYQCFAEILFLVCQYELRNLEGMDYCVTNARNRLYRKGRLGPVEKRILKLFHQIPGAKNKDGERDLFKSCRDNLVPLYKDPQHAPLIHYFDFILWIDATMDGQPMYRTPSRVKDGHHDVASSL